MKRFALAIVAIAALSAPAMAVNCAKDYKDFWELDRQKFPSCLPSRSPISAARPCAATMRARRATSGSRPTTSSRSSSRKRMQRRRTSSRTALSGPLGRQTRRSKQPASIE